MPKLISVEYREAPGAPWRPLTAIQPRQPNATKYLVTLPATLPGEVTLRMSSWDGIHVKQIGLLRSFDPQPYTMEELPKAAVIDAQSGRDISGLISSKDREFLRLRTGDRVRLVFSDRAMPGPRHSFVVRASGFYVEAPSPHPRDRRLSRLALLAGWLEERVIALEQMLATISRAGGAPAAINRSASQERIEPVEARDPSTGEVRCVSLTHGTWTARQGTCR